ncbi:hypothetical protein [Microbulbifer celer]|uniref:Uncharacterized protein n=1 Tax=Microbulbifer celer TaxID=435905 RepID=A0ABW3UA60_9GAMM|nr:hypothetical protein [Microbulbifer celer]UFN56858.1 hypothetical protein LPW13_14975 [Microbulbifer celer]
MELPKHTRNALLVSVKIQELGIPVEIQHKIGVFAVAWGMFESHLERAVWALEKEQVAGNRPSTDKTSAYKWVGVLSSGSEDLSAKANEVLAVAAGAAKDLMSYRHSLFHGYLVPLGGTAMFIRNPRWDGEVRNREAGDAQIEENIVDLAIDAAWVLFRIVIAVTKLGEENGVSNIETFESEARRIKSNANEVRHIASLATHEKY